MAAKQEIRAYPTRTNQIPRHIPPPHWASHPAVLYLAAGLLPFGTIFVELYFAMTSIWQVRTPPRLARHLAQGCAQPEGMQKGSHCPQDASLPRVTASRQKPFREKHAECRASLLLQACCACAAGL